MANTVNVRILPGGASVPAVVGEILLDVLRRGGLSIEAECGGQGTCGRCAVEIVSGGCDVQDAAPGASLPKGWVLACLAAVREDISVRIPEAAAHSWNGGSSPYLTRIPRVESRLAVSPPTRKFVIRPPAPSAHASDVEQLGGKLERADWSLAALRALPDAVRHDCGVVTVTLADLGGGPRAIRLEAGDRSGVHCGIACDIGTTTVAVELVDLTTGEVAGVMGAYNDQIDCGADVISRIIFSQKGRHLEELRTRVLGTINRLVDALVKERGLSRDDVTAGFFSGNTTMTHLALGVSPRSIREAPYQPAMKSVPVLEARTVGIGIHPEAPVMFAPCVGSWVGGDITSGLLCLRRLRSGDGVTLFVDIGTNGEMVLAGDGWMVGCACSAGPAFEGVGIRCGMRAARGAIDSVQLSRGGSSVDLHVIGDAPAAGLCGSGLIELVAELLAEGVIGRDGRFTERAPAERMRAGEDGRSFVVAEAGRTVVISERDIASIMRAKAAIYSALSLFLKRLGLSQTDLHRVYVAGGFGERLDVEAAISIGMFPDIGAERFEYLGNTSLLGSYLALVSADARVDLKQIAGGLTYMDLSSEPDYMHEYTAALFLPHTELGLFPNAAGRRRSSGDAR